MDANEFSTPDAVVIYPSRGRVFLLLLTFAAFAVLSILLSRTGQNKHLVAGVAGGVFFGACMLFAIAKLIRREPALVINAAGILENSSALGRYALLWDEVESIYISSVRTSEFSSQRFLSIRLKRTEEFLKRQSTLRAWLMKINVGLVGAPVNISANVLPLTLEELIQIIQQKYPTAPPSVRS